jgi:GT2 family glycosyltransferase
MVASPQAPVRVAVVIPVFNRKESTLMCLHDLAAQTGVAVTIWVVDDASTDGTPDAVRERFPDVRIVEGDGNLWWTGGTNAGIRAVLAEPALPDYVLTLNNDTRIAPAYLATLVESARAHPRTLVGSLAVRDDAPEVIQDGGSRVSWWTAKFTRIARGGSRTEARSGLGRYQSVDVLSGRGMLIPAEVFSEAGLFDERRLPHYAADYEFSVRARRHGFALLVDYDAVVVAATGLTGLNNEERALPWKDLFRSFTSRRSPYNVAARLNFARCAAPAPIWPLFFFCDILRVVAGRIRNQMRQQNAKDRA